MPWPFVARDASPAWTTHPPLCPNIKTLHFLAYIASPLLASSLR